MNHIYRSIWNEKTGTFVAVSENTKSDGKSASSGDGVTSAGFALKALTLSLMLAFGTNSYALPTGGTVAAGNASITNGSGSMTINQSSQNAVLNWNSFNIGTGESVTFVQPNSRSVALNRVLGSDPSSILGSLSANGKVFLVNPNGILFGKGAQVNVGGLAASTLNISDSDFMAGNYHFAGASNGSVINQGAINADGGYVALLGANVSNQGTITARLGTVALAAGNAVTLDVAGDGLLNVAVNDGAVQALVQNSGLIQADGGQVLMTAQAAGNLLRTAVNNTGVIQARTIENHGGVIKLLGDMQSGTVNVGGTLDASAPDGGNGGFIETSAAHVKTATDTHITTAAPHGMTGSWLIDPVDYTIAASGGDITGAALSANLGSTDVTILSTSGGSGTNGDVNVNDTVTWSANKLTLNAQNNININANLNASATASLALQYGQGAVAAGNTSNVITHGGAVNLPASTTNFTTKQGSNGSVKAYTVITSLGAAGSTTATDLQGMSGNLATNYALGSNIDASATSNWNAGAGFAPVADNVSRYTGTFDGLGHIISSLFINRPTTNFIGLFGFINGGVLRNVGLVGGSVTGGAVTGALLGINYGSVSNSYATGSVTGADFTGGLIASNRGTVSDSYAAGNVSGGDQVGGLMGGHNNGTISNSYATGNVTGTGGATGGLVGYSAATISNSHTTGTVSGVTQVGGIVGAMNGSTISNSYATGAVTGTDRIGGLIGNSSNGTVSNSYATGAVNGNNFVGGLMGSSTNATINTSYATGAVAGSSSVGALVGTNSGTVTNSYWNSTVNGALSGIGGGTTAGSTGLTNVQMQSASNFAGFTFTTTAGATGNNWVMVDVDGTLNNTGGALGGTRPMLASEYSTTINNAHQLQLMSMNLAGKYMLGQNINAAATGTASDVWSASTFIPVGAAAGKFTGTFDGQGHTINNLTVNMPTAQYAGLFGWTNGSTISNVGMIGGSVSGKDFVGGLVGLNDASSISNSYNTGTVAGTGNCIGGLVGANGDNSYSTIDNSYATGDVTGNGANFYVGGLVGVQQHGAISNSYATGDVINGGDTIGGLVGFLHNSSISNSYSSGAVAGTATVGGFVGYNIGSVATSYWNTTANDGLAGAGASTTGMTGLTSVEMQTASNFTGFNFTTTPGATGNNWVMVGIDGTLNSGDGTRPMLASEYSTTINNAHQLQLMSMNLSANYTLGQNIDAAATGTANNVWANGTFVPVGKDGAHFTGTLNGLGHTISALNITMPDFGLPGFGLTATADEAGLFGHIGASGHVQNVGLVGGSVIGRDFVGSLAGINDGTITNSYATGVVQARSYVGGLIGRSTSGSTTSGSHATGAVTAGLGSAGGLVGNNEGTLTGDYATGAVHAGDEAVGGFSAQAIGGLVGHNDGSIAYSYASGSVTAVNGSSYVGGLAGRGFSSSSVSNSYATGAVQGPNSVGGLLGINYGTVSNTYATGSVEGTSNAGGLIGTNYGSVNRSFWDTQTSGQASSNGGTGLTSSQMMQLSSFSSWNTASPNTVAATGNSGASWRIYEGNTAPLLTQFLTALTLTDNATVTYDGAVHSSDLAVPNDVFSITKTNVGTYAAFYSNQQGYDISGGTLTINKANLTLSGTRAYDGSSVVAGSVLTATGVNGETFAVTDDGDTTNLASKNVQAGSALASVTGLELGASSNGGLSGNYNALSTTSSTFSITQANLTLATSNISKAYDGGLTAAGSATVTGGILFGSDSLSGGTFAFTDKNVGSGNKTVTTSGVSINDGNSGGNYNVSYANNNTSTITAKALTATVVVPSKMYDGTTTAAPILTITSGLIGTETVSANGTASFNSKDVASANLVTVNSTVLADGSNGGLASNYSLINGQTTTAHITAKPLTITGMTAANKIYDGNTSATLNGGTLNGLIGSETLAFSGQIDTFTDKNVGNGKTVTVNGVTLANGSGLASNYSVANSANLNANITRLDSVAWVGGTTGSWFDPANWANGAVPDLSNVANVVIPNGVTASFDNSNIVLPAQAGAVHLDSISGAGGLSLVDGDLSTTDNVLLANLDISGGALVVGGDINIGSFSQSGGSVANTGNFTATNAFNQSNGAINVRGNVDITQVSGSALLGNIAVDGALGVTATTGDITQTVGTTIAAKGITTLSAPNGTIDVVDSSNNNSGGDNNNGSGDNSDNGSDSNSGNNLVRVQNAIAAAASSLASMSSETRTSSLAGNQNAGTSYFMLSPTPDSLAGLNVTIVDNGIKLPSDVDQTDTSNDKSEK